VQNRGWEAVLNANVLDMRNVRFDATISMSENHNKVVNLGEGVVPILFGFSSTQQHRNDFPLGGYFQRKYTYEDLNDDGIISRVNCPTTAGVANPQLAGGPRCEVTLTDSVEYLGTPLPTHEASLSTQLELFRYLHITTLWNYRGGYKLFNSTREFRCGQFLNCRDIQDNTAPLDDQAKVIARLMGTATGYIEDASFVKLRELGITLLSPEQWSRRVGAQQLSLTLAFRNVAVWTDYTGFDPEVNSNITGSFTASDFLALPPVRYATLRLNLNF
jgi:hypothetical protein